jgi:ATP-dependent helicase/nuclease subunit B
MESEVINALAQGATVVTANRRLARHLAVRYAGVQQHHGRQVWETPDVLPWSAWLARVWGSWFDDAFDLDVPPPTLLTAEQEETLWEAVIQRCEAHNPLFNVRAAARLAREAWELWQAWRLPLSKREASGLDTQAFLRWAAAFTARCEGQRWLDNARLADFVAKEFSAGRLSVPAQLWLAGFDEFTPQQRALLEVLQNKGCSVRVVAPDAHPRGEAVRVAAPDAEQEILLAARWARARLEENPRARIGVVVPDLGALRTRIACTFEDVLHPAAVLPGVAHATPTFNISLGLPLGDCPLVYAALTILEFTRERLPLTQVGSLLRSPFLGGGETEIGRRALLDVKLRQLGEGEITRRMLMRVASMQDEVGNPRSFACPQLVRILRGVERLLRCWPARQCPSAWAQSFAQLLQAWGWPGERARNSDEFQTLEAWRRALHALAGLERVKVTLSLGEALSRLRQIAQVPFQPESVEAPVQVLGMLEAAGARFDCLWLLGMHDETWPAAARPNPLLPIALQRAHGVPHASATRELDYARTVTVRLLASAPAAVVSYPTSEGDRELIPSPLIADLPEVARDRVAVYAGDSWETLIFQSARLETFADDRGPALHAAAQVAGGARLLEDQAACPFRAFALHRLGAQAMEEPSLGLDSAERGSLAHLALERLWSALKTYERLCGLDETELRELVRASAADAIQEFLKHRGGDRGRRFYVIEQARLERLLGTWLELEKQRAPFEVVALEQEQTLRLGGLTLRTRVDRIDQLLAGGRIIIDYKTGEAKPPAWFDERLEQAQLPLYSACDPGGERPVAVLLAHVRQGGMQYKGVAAQDALVPGVRALQATKEGHARGDWDALLASWARALETLAAEVAAGWAVIGPKKYPVTCKFCALPLLCRMQEVFGGAPRLEDELE